MGQLGKKQYTGRFQPGHSSSHSKCESSSGWGPKQDLDENLQENHFECKDTNRSKVKEWKVVCRASNTDGLKARLIGCIHITGCSRAGWSFIVTETSVASSGCNGPKCT